MAKQRSISTKIWSDTYFDTLDPIEKLLFLYLLTNIYTNICGIYELPIKVMATETGIDRDMVKKVLQRLENDQKVFFIDGYICIRNFIKNQSVNPSVLQGIDRELKEKPKELIDKISDIYNVYTGCIQDGLLNLTKPNLTQPNEDGEQKSKSEINKQKKKEKEAADLDIMNKFIEDWNAIDKIGGKKGLIKMTIIPEGFKEVFIKKLNLYGLDIMKLGVNNYCKDIANRKRRHEGDDFPEHRRNLYTFLKQHNGLDTFINKN